MHRSTIQVIYQYAFPTLQSLGLSFGTMSFVQSPVTDREEKMRYLLNFAGMRSSAYYLSFMFADVIIYLIPQLLLMISVVILQIEAVVDTLGAFFLSIFFFSFPFLAFTYLIGMIFDKKETATKWIIWCNMAMTLVGYGIQFLFLYLTKSPIASSYIAEILIPIMCLNNNISYILNNLDNQFSY